MRTTIALGLAVFSLASAAFAADYQLKRTAKGHKELTVYGHAIFRGDCESRGPVEINLTIPPMGGLVCMRSGMVPLRTTWPGTSQHCVGKRISGVFVIYIPFGSFTGIDTMLYTVKGMTKMYTYEFEITVGADQATAAGASSAPSEPQKAGPMPTCPALVS